MPSPTGVRPYAHRLDGSASARRRAWTVDAGTITAAGLVPPAAAIFSADRTVTVTAAVGGRCPDRNQYDHQGRSPPGRSSVTAAAFVALTDAATVATDVNDWASTPR
jgi:hypothetical protein